MRTLFNFAILSAIAFSSVAVGQEETSQIDEVAVEIASPASETPVSILDLGPAPSDAEIDTARAASVLTHVSDGIVAATPAYFEPLDQGVTYAEYIVTQDCGCQSGTIAPVVYQEPTIQGVVESVGEIAVEGSMEPEPVADAASVVESTISTESAPVYVDSGVVTEGTSMTYEGEPVVVEGAPVDTSAPSCDCSQGTASALAPTEGLISAPEVSYQSAPVSTLAPAADCCPQARRGFFRRLFGR